jgi:hypothetical protein
MIADLRFVDKSDNAHDREADVGVWLHGLWVRWQTFAIVLEIILVHYHRTGVHE